MNVYEYLFAGVLIIAILVGSSLMVATISTPIANASDKDLLKVTAQKVTTQMFLDPGYPYDWGTNNSAAQNLQVFGLAQNGLTSRQAYILDPDKALRLDSSIEPAFCHVDAVDAAGLLGLANGQGTLDYGFTLRFNQTLLLDATQLPNNAYRVNVASDYGLPVIGASVSATLYYADDGIQSLGPIYNSTAYDGTSLLDFNYNITNPRVLAVAVDYYGDQATKLFGESPNAISAQLFADNILLPQNSYTATDCNEIALIQSTLGIETRAFPQSVAHSDQNGFALGQVPETASVAVLIESGQSLIYAQRDYSKINYQTINLDAPVPSAALSYSLERTVLIGGSTYTVTLYIWRMST
jgi:hypothetical protein